MRNGRRTKRQVMAALAVFLVCGCPVGHVWKDMASAKDQRDLQDLTGAWLRSRAELLLPNELPVSGVMGEVYASGMSLSYPSETDRASRVVTYDIRLADDRGEAPWLVSCNATMVVVCTDLGAGYTLVTVLDTFNSHAATSVRRRAGDRLFNAGVQGNHPDDVARLRRIVTETHPPTDAELLRILRPDGYQTDWS